MLSFKLEDNTKSFSLLIVFILALSFFNIILPVVIGELRLELLSFSFIFDSPLVKLGLIIVVILFFTNRIKQINFKVLLRKFVLFFTISTIALISVSIYTNLTKGNVVSVVYEEAYTVEINNTFERIEPKFYLVYEDRHIEYITYNEFGRYLGNNKIKEVVLNRENITEASYVSGDGDKWIVKLS